MVATRFTVFGAISFALALCDAQRDACAGRVLNTGLISGDGFAVALLRLTTLVAWGAGQAFLGVAVL